MVESQVRPNGITDARIISLMAAIPREVFVPVDLRAVAYMDEDIRLKPATADALARYLTEPMSLARLLQLASIKSTDVILHIGCATGYGTAVLAGLGHSVLAIEEDANLADMAAANLAETDVANAKVENAKHAEGFTIAAPYDVIFIEGQIPDVPQVILKQLEQDGRLVAIVGEGRVAKAELHTRHGGTVSARAAFDASVPPLPGFPTRRKSFVF